MSAARAAASPWTALLEALHSALIDELNERLPREKPELGLPMRQSALVLPDGAETALVVEATVGDARGLCVLAAQGATIAKRAGALPELWASVLRRAKPDLERRAVQARWSQARALGKESASKVIWIPLGVAGGKLWLGVGI